MPNSPSQALSAQNEHFTVSVKARYRTHETNFMPPEDVFNASKIIKDLNEVQKKASSLCDKLKKEKRLSSILKSDISRIDDLDEMNETVKAGIHELTSPGSTD